MQIIFNSSYEGPRSSTVFAKACTLKLPILEYRVGNAQSELPTQRSLTVLSAKAVLLCTGVSFTDTLVTLVNSFEAEHASRRHYSLRDEAGGCGRSLVDMKTVITMNEHMRCCG